MSAGSDRHGALRNNRRRALSMACAVIVALAAAGCSDSSGNGGSSANSPPLVTGEQVVTSCFQNYFYNGILPKAAAKSNCTDCVVSQLRHLGIQPATGENVIDMLTGDRLSTSEINSLQNRCNESDANAQ